MLNLRQYFEALQRCSDPGFIKFGFIHKEPKGIKAIDQRGSGRNLQQTRLYIYPDLDNKILHLITIGNKN